MMDNWTGTLRLGVKNQDGKTIAKSVYFQGALKVMRPIYHDSTGQACYYLLNPGGGYVGGDRYQIQITLEEQSNVILTTQSATKVYKTMTTPAYQQTEISLKSGSHFEYIPDPLIMYANACYQQKNVIDMEKGSTLLLSDIVTPGWSPNGDDFKYTQLQLKNEIYMDGDLVVYDHIQLKPPSQNIEKIGFMEGFSHLGSMMVIGEQTNQALLDRLFREIKSETGDYRWGLSLLPIPGLIIRVLANATQTIEELFTICRNHIYQEWFQTKPCFLRKY